ncbi:hypothetical protein BX070DRAFT_229109 [Coemansia spiralis]|nr:hypothetical protein BX070DRAFT_229109 [Coemansia spiralis]
MYQYEHVNRQGSSPHTTNLSQGNHEQLHSGSGDYLASVSSLTASNTEPALEDSDDLESKPVPFPRSDSVSSMPVNDPLLDPSMLCNLSEKSRNEILTQKLISAVASNPAVDVLDASRIVDSFIKRPLEDVLAMLSDPGLLASEWEHEQRANMHMPQYMHNMATSVNQIASSSPTTVSSTHAAAGETDGVVGAVAQQLQGASVADYDDADTDEQQARKSRGSSGGIHLPNYDTETEEFIEMLLSKPENVRKMKLGSKLFPMIKGMGYSESTKLTVWILDHMSQDVRTLAYTLNDISKLREIVDEAQQAISTGR